KPPADVLRGMVLVEGKRDPLRGAGGAPEPAFYIDATEMTVGGYLQTKGVKLAPPMAALAPGPTDALRFIEFDRALQHAETIGKRLPSEREYRAAATQGGVTRFPWGDDPRPMFGQEWSLGPVRAAGFDRTPDPPIFGLYSNVAEFTLSWLTSDS